MLEYKQPLEWTTLRSELALQPRLVACVADGHQKEGALYLDHFSRMCLVLNVQHAVHDLLSG